MTSINNNHQSDFHSKLPNSIKIDDITSGKIDPQSIYDEIDRLKAEINILRNDMSLFLKALATIPSNQSQQEYYKVVVSRLKTVQVSINEYCEKYNKLLPIINLAQIKLGHDVEAPPPNKVKSEASTNNNTPNMVNKTTPVMGNTATPTTTSTASNSGYQSPNGRVGKKTTKKASVSNKGMGSSNSQPIVI
ncbi:hypothetical protein SBY92_002128 [Candida maltosa Xu316]|uniref:Uncharacterized protein n=1 Tax=Candida maltosa (strain Xu316) TaxID=1245528 RepID=M3HIB1_CANMX|nr:hypothetical protein G210_2642 [Candida maltosa Xu316]